MGIKNRWAVRDRREYKKTVLETKVHNGLYCLKRRIWDRSVTR